MKVYLIDDDPLTLMILSNMLIEAGLTPKYSLPTDPHLYKRVEEFKPDVIVLDLYMPNTGGIYVSDRIRQITSLEDIPIIAISASTSFEDKVKVMNKSFIDYLEKPLERVNFIKKVSRYAKLGHIMNSCTKIKESILTT